MHEELGGTQALRDGEHRLEVGDLGLALEAGTNIVTTVSDLFARGSRLSDENRARVVAACEKGKASVWASGSDPGFITETLPMALLSVQRQLQCR